MLCFGVVSCGLNNKNMMTTATMARQIIDALSPEKAKEWRDWGKQAYKSRSSMMRGNKHHPDYDTREKCEAVHDANEAGTGESAYNFTKEGRERLTSRYGYTDSAIDEARA